MIRLSPLPAGLAMRDPAVLIATGFGSGRLSPAPGTWGTLAAWLIGAALGKAALLPLLVLALAGGYWAIRSFEAASNSHDPGMIVIDEWAGVWVAMLFAAWSPAGWAWDQLLLALVLFRGFDILKPWPIRWLDRNLPGPWGVIVDDLAAGLAAGLLVYGYGIWTV